MRFAQGIFNVVRCLAAGENEAEITRSFRNRHQQLTFSDGDDDFFDAPYGTPQIETMLTIMYDEGVNGGWITLPRLVEVMSENPARTFGLYPQKGALQEGSDADVVLFDPTCRHTLQAANLHSNTGFTLFEGREVVGKPVLTMQRGRVVMADGKILGQAGQGRFLRTDTSHLYDD